MNAFCTLDERCSTVIGASRVIARQITWYTCYGARQAVNISQQSAAKRLRIGEICSIADLLMSVPVQEF